MWKRSIEWQIQIETRTCASRHDSLHSHSHLHCGDVIPGAARARLPYSHLTPKERTYGTYRYYWSDQSHRTCSWYCWYLCRAQNRVPPVFIHRETAHRWWSAHKHKWKVSLQMKMTFTVVKQTVYTECVNHKTLYKYLFVLREGPCVGGEAVKRFAFKAFLQIVHRDGRLFITWQLGKNNMDKSKQKIQNIHV